MILGLDLDGCMYDFAAAMRDYIEHATGRPRVTMPLPKAFFLGSEWGIERDEFIGLCHDAVDAGWLFRVGEPTKNAPEVCRQLKAEGHSIHIITARNFGLRSLSNTEQWLHEHAIPFDDITFTSDKARVACDLYLDDKPEHYAEYEAAGLLAYLYDQPWNTHVLARRILDWKHFDAEVRSL